MLQKPRQYLFLEEKLKAPSCVYIYAYVRFYVTEV